MKIKPVELKFKEGKAIWFDRMGTGNVPTKDFPVVTISCRLKGVKQF